MAKARILIMEDSPTQAASLSGLLEERGYDTTVAPNGEEGLRRIEELDFDLVITDVQMPGMDGYEACRQIKQNWPDLNLPVLLLTQLSDPMDIIRGLECGADNYLTKPYEPEPLVERVEHMLDVAKARKDGFPRLGVQVRFLDTTLTISADKQQILNLLISSFEDLVRTNATLRERRKELAAAQAQLKEYAEKMRQEAHISTEKYRSLMQQAADGIFVLDREGRILEANKHAADLVCSDREELVDQPLTRFLEGDDARTIADVFRRVHSGIEAKISEVRFVTDGGALRVCELSTALVKEGREEYFLTIVRDVTQRRQLERELRVSQKMEAIGRLAGGVAHDFNNLLTAILGNVSLLRGEPELDSSEECDAIERAATQASRLTRQLLTFSKSRMFEPQVVDLNHAIVETKELLQRTIGRDIRIETNLSQDVPPVLIDGGQFEQVILNLAVNARDAMPDGGLLQIETESVDGVKADAETTPLSGVLLSVSDTGQGMSKEVQAQVLEPFYTTKEEGTGLGLSTVYGIVSKSGGRIDIESEVGSGTTFRILLPAHDGSPDATAGELEELGS